MGFSIFKPLGERHKPGLMAWEIWRYIGPGLLVTVGFIDPGNWASNVAAGAGYGYTLLWMVTLSTAMLIVLQHNAAHLGIVTGLCLSEASTAYLPKTLSRLVLGTAVAAAVSTALAELLGGAIALGMLFHIPIPLGTFLTLGLVVWMIFSNSYQKLEKYIIGFVSLIGICFIYELSLVHLDWAQAARAWVVPVFPDGAMPIIMSVLGAVVMPHNLFLHSEIIQSRQWNLKDPEVIHHQLRYEFLDTLISMLVGWAINSAMILMAAATFFRVGEAVDTLEQAKAMLEPLLGPASALVFALALLLAGVASSLTAAMAGGGIFAGIFGEPYNTKDIHTRWGVGLTLGLAAGLILLVGDPFKGLVYSQIALSVQLPVTILLQLYLTSSRKVMGSYANTTWHTVVLAAIALTVIALNVALLVSLL